MSILRLDHDKAHEYISDMQHENHYDEFRAGFSAECDNLTLKKKPCTRENMSYYLVSSNGKDFLFAVNRMDISSMGRITAYCSSTPHSRVIAINTVTGYAVYCLMELINELAINSAGEVIKANINSRSLQAFSELEQLVSQPIHRNNLTDEFKQYLDRIDKVQLDLHTTPWMCNIILK